MFTRLPCLRNITLACPNQYFLARTARTNMIGAATSSRCLVMSWRACHLHSCIHFILLPSTFRRNMPFLARILFPPTNGLLGGLRVLTTENGCGLINDPRNVVDNLHHQVAYRGVESQLYQQTAKISTGTVVSENVGLEECLAGTYCILLSP